MAIEQIRDLSNSPWTLEKGDTTRKATSLKKDGTEETIYFYSKSGYEEVQISKEVYDILKKENLVTVIE